MSVRILISDSNIWIDFRHAGLIDDLFRLPYSFASTDFVLAELVVDVAAVLLDSGLIVEELSPAEVQELAGLIVAHNNSSFADVSCYFVARVRGHSLLTGDGRLRKQAEGDGVVVHGALWLLDELVTHGVITPARAYDALQAMLLNKARLPLVECERRLAEWFT